MITRYLIIRDGREYFMQEVPPWAQDNPEYEVVKLASVGGNNVVTINTDDTQERIQLMNDLFELQQNEIDQLKHSLEGFVEVIEGIIDLTEVVSQNNIENRSKLLVISKSCKEILKPSE